MRAGSITFTFCVFISVTYQGILGYNDDNKSGESMEIGSEVRNVSESSSSAEGPPDSHEAMNNRELKPKLTIGDRKKRSYQFLMGIVKRNNSNYEITSDERAVSKNAPVNEAKASELLLELMVKIAENPEQWSKVHDLLQKIDKDLLKSKQIIDNMKNTVHREEKEVDTNTQETIEDQMQWVRSENSTEDIHRLVLSHDRNKKNTTDKALETNQWMAERQPSETTKYPWQISTKPSKSYQKNFAYHRVTGNPLIHTNFNKNPKAYIAVSVIAPKPLQPRTDEDDVMLENELKELKPWTHQQNLKNMAQIRSRWVIQSNEKKSLYSP